MQSNEERGVHLKSAERRAEILNILQHRDVPIAAKDLAAHFHVSRQVIVQDIAVIRATFPGIVSTCRGYTISKQSCCYSREFKVCHTAEEAARELNLIVDCGGAIKNVSIKHRIYGRIMVEMDISSRQDVEEFLELLQSGKSTLLANAAAGYHYHLVEAASEERLDLIAARLEEAGFLAPLTPWEKETEGESNQ
jgi:transcriptional regulator of NAD metabolism